jgi:hypothetical protein
MKLVRKLELGRGTYERYQQVYGDVGAYVLGGQIGVYRNVSGTSHDAVGETPIGRPGTCRAGQLAGVR